ncbi:YaaC family protein, partial [Methylobacterium fujisawaense]
SGPSSKRPDDALFAPSTPFGSRCVASPSPYPPERHLRPLSNYDKFVRASVNRFLYAADTVNRLSGPPNISVMIHPTSSALLEQWQNAMIFRNPLCDSIDFQEGGGGGNLRIDFDHVPFDQAELPSSTNLNDDQIVFWPNNKCLNEFGYLYIGLHILGNFARYFPDLWMKAVEDSHPIATVAERFLEVAEVRMPLAILSELSRSYHVVKA